MEPELREGDQLTCDTCSMIYIVTQDIHSDTVVEYIRTALDPQPRGEDTFGGCIVCPGYFLRHTKTWEAHTEKGWF